jgi:O-acetyl-ADP-ribose deacetylase (regulator of RNase III)
MARGDERIELALGDITEQRVDAIVNAANRDLIPGGGVDGAINRAGGPAIGAAMRETGGCATGDAVPTTAGELPARYVVHAVGPIWRGGGEGEPELLARAHRRAVEVAAELGCRSLAFPAISCGVYGYPPELAAPVAIAAVRDAIDEAPSIELVRFVLFSEPLYAMFAESVGGIADG